MQIEFNTGRYYAPEGQVIEAELTDAGFHYNSEAEDYAIRYWCSLRKEVERGPS